MDTEQVFQLIDRILPFEACLYHQVLPLSVDKGCLKLGMVMLDDTAALDYVRRMVGYINYTLAPQSLSSETHYATLSAYLNHAQAKKTAPQGEEQARSEEAQEPVVMQAEPEFVRELEPTPEPAIAPTPKLSIEQPIKPAQPPQQKPLNPDFHAKATYVVDSPDELDWSETYETPPVHPLLAKELPSIEPQLPTLDVSMMYLHSPIEELSKLPPGLLLKELLGRILMDGIGRLYFERQPNYGRVLWSQNGVLQSVVDQLPLHVFQGLIEELKQLTHLPAKPVKQVQQVEIERLCQRSRVLLRLRVMPNAQGEEATLQVLRGAALKFYQKQQLTNLSRDALGVAKQLQHKISQIRDRHRKASQLVLDQTLVQPTLTQVAEIVEQQLVDLKEMQGSN